MNLHETQKKVVEQIKEQMAESSTAIPRIVEIQVVEQIKEQMVETSVAIPRIVEIQVVEQIKEQMVETSMVIPSHSRDHIVELSMVMPHSDRRMLVLRLHLLGRTVVVMARKLPKEVDYSHTETFRDNSAPLASFVDFCPPTSIGTQGTVGFPWLQPVLT